MLRSNKKKVYKVQIPDYRKIKSQKMRIIKKIAKKIYKTSKEIGLPTLDWYITRPHKEDKINCDYALFVELGKKRGRSENKIKSDFKEYLLRGYHAPYINEYIRTIEDKEKPKNTTNQNKLEKQFNKHKEKHFFKEGAEKWCISQKQMFQDFEKYLETKTLPYYARDIKRSSKK